MAEKRKIHRVVDAQGTLVQVLPETSAEQVTVADTANNFTSTNVEGVLAELATMAQTGGVTGVKGDAETAYRKGNVNITKANIGLGNVDNTADANKSVASAVKATQDGDGNVIKSTYATKTEVTNGLNGKLDKTGGSITGNLTIGGNLAVNGTTTTIDSTTLQVKDKLIEVAHGNTTKLTSPAGLVVPKYDGTNSGALVFDGDGMAQVGKVVLDAAGNIDTTKSGLQTLATRTNLVGGNLVQYDSTNKTLVDSGKKVGDLVTTNTPQTITGKKTFSDDLIVDSISTSNNLNVFSKSTINNELVFGSPSGTTSLTGSEDRPTYKLSDGTRKDIALLSDVQGTKVDNAKYADSAGYVKNSMVYQGVGMNADANYSNFVTYNGSAARSIKFYKYDFQMLDALGSGDAELSLRSTGVTAGAYSAVTVDAKGRVTAGGKSIEWGTTGQTAPSDDLMVGGLFFELQ
jgi:hypothetical protein